MEYKKLTVEMFNDALSEINKKTDEVKDIRTYEDFKKFIESDFNRLCTIFSISPYCVSDFLISQNIYKMKKPHLEEFQSPQQVDEAIQRIVEYYFEDEYKDWEMEDHPEDHIAHSLNILKTLYEQGGPEKNF